MFFFQQKDYDIHNQRPFFVHKMKIPKKWQIPLKVEYADPDQFDDYKKSRDGDRDEGPNDDNEDEDDHIGLHGDNDGEGAKRARYQGPHQLS